MSSLTKKNSDTSLKFVYSDNNSLSVIFHDNELLIGVVGEFNKNLKELEKAFSEKEPKLDLKFVKCHADAVSPSYNYPTDSGFDLHSTESIMIPPLSRMVVGTGLKFNIKDGYEIQIRPKSGLALKQGLTVLNTPGTVDAGYDGEIKVIIFNTTNKPITINKGMKVGQAVLCPVVCGKYVEIEIVQNIEKKERGINGFGSTGLF